MNIRREDSENLGQRSQIRAVIEAAFGSSEEAGLVDRLRASEHVLSSLVAEVEGAVIGHILFSRMWIETSAGLVNAVALAPLAVRPDRQRQGVGSQLIQHGLELMRDQGEGIVIVAGHPGYYPKFGFSSDKASPLESPFPREAFMALELRAGALRAIAGSVLYPPAFGFSAPTRE